VSIREYDEYQAYYQACQPSSQSKSDWFGTASGRVVYALSPNDFDVNIADIAHSLARQCRFAGHLRQNVWHYSVAQHSVLVSMVCEQRHALHGLLHDAHEAYTQDIIRPLQCLLSGEYKAAAKRWKRVIGEAYGLSDGLVNLPSDVKRADNALLATERRDVIEHRGRVWNISEEPIAMLIEPLSAQDAYALFMHRFVELSEREPRSYVT
jgi:5'-deoxynucleotidase YfbR-like HD superfamily hydrolase